MSRRSERIVQGGETAMEEEGIGNGGGGSGANEASVGRERGSSDEVVGGRSPGGWGSKYLSKRYTMKRTPLINETKNIPECAEISGRVIKEDTFFRV